MKVIFDMDGVIVDSNPFHRKAWKAFCDKHGLNVTDEQLETTIFGRSGQEGLPLLFPEKNLTAEQVDAYVKEIDKNFRDLFEAHAKPVEGFMEFLHELRAADIKYAVATSAPVLNIEMIMNVTGLKKYFDIIIDASQITKSKPSPEIYLKTAERLGADPKKCVVIEDSLSGIKSALNAGMKVVGITTTHSPEELNGTHLVINNFRELNIARLKQLVKA